MRFFFRTAASIVGTAALLGAILALVLHFWPGTDRITVAAAAVSPVLLVACIALAVVCLLYVRALLRLVLNAPAPPPLATATLLHPNGTDLILGVLGASHVIQVRGRFSEQVSCAMDTQGSTLPESAQAPGYRLQSHTAVHDEGEFRRIATELRDRCARENGWLGGTFPGDDAALTALAAEPDGAGWSWQTWHLYPAAPGGTVVHTRSRWLP